MLKQKKLLLVEVEAQLSFYKSVMAFGRKHLPFARNQAPQ